MTEEESAVTIELSNFKALAAVLLVGLSLGFASGFAVNSSVSLSAPSPDNSSESGLDTMSLDGVEIDGEPSLGDSDAEIKMIEYTDLGCPFCAEWHGVDASGQINIDQRQVFQQVKSEFIDTGKIEFITKDYPAHPNAMQAHIAANCVYEQNESAYYDYYKDTMEQRDRWMEAEGNNTDALVDIASEMDINQEQFNECYSNGDTSEIMGDVRAITEADGRIGTPAFYIGNKERGFIKISGAQPFAKFEETINKFS